MLTERSTRRSRSRGGHGMTRRQPLRTNCRPPAIRRFRPIRPRPVPPWRSTRPRPRLRPPRPSSQPLPAVSLSSASTRLRAASGVGGRDRGRQRAQDTGLNAIPELIQPMDEACPRLAKSFAPPRSGQVWKATNAKTPNRSGNKLCSSGRRSASNLCLLAAGVISGRDPRGRRRRARIAGGRPAGAAERDARRSRRSKAG